MEEEISFPRGGAERQPQQQSSSASKSSSQSEAEKRKERIKNKKKGRKRSDSKDFLFGTNSNSNGGNDSKNEGHVLKKAKKSRKNQESFSTGVVELAAGSTSSTSMKMTTILSSLPLGGGAVQQPTDIIHTQKTSIY